MKTYGCVPDQKDDRDHNFMASWFSKPRPVAPAAAPLDLFAWFPPVMYQGVIGSCTAHGVDTALRYNDIDNNRPDVPLSRAQMYFDAGVLEGSTADTGRQIRDVIKVAASGVQRESVWPYPLGPWDVSTYADRYREAPAAVAGDYQRVDVSVDAVRAALFVGRPVIVGLDVYKQFESDEAEETGVIRTPNPRTETPVARHCVVIGAEQGYGIFRNSWGLSWGVQGNGSIAREYYASPSFGSDFWTIHSNKDLTS